MEGEPKAVDEVLQNPWKLLGPPPGVCQECAVDHDPTYPHDAISLYYRYRFYSATGRWPTWRDAMAHCSQEMRDAWAKLLLERGITLDGPVRGANTAPTGETKETT